MMFSPTIVKNVIHPLVATAFIKHSFTAPGHASNEDILVIDAHRGVGQSADDVQAAILADMDLILDQVHRTSLNVDSVEIRVHH